VFSKVGSARSASLLSMPLLMTDSGITICRVRCGKQVVKGAATADDADGGLDVVLPEEDRLRTVSFKHY
jgi:hypothetical protein